MKTIEVTITGAHNILQNILKDIENAIPVVAGAMHEYSEETMVECKKIVPHKDGILENSGYVKPVEIDGKDIHQTIGFGGQAKAYAEKQHENLTFKHPNGRQAKYLEVPVARSKKGYAKRIAERAKARRGGA